MSRTPLHSAAIEGNAKAIVASVEASADPDAHDASGKTPFD